MYLQSATLLADSTYAERVAEESALTALSLPAPFSAPCFENIVFVAYFDYPHL